MPSILSIDGSAGEGGGQILRTSLGLSLLTGKPFRIEGIRAGRKKPGLLRQHLTAVIAAAAVGHAEVRGASMGALELEFFPGETSPGSYSFNVGTAGSTTLVLQSILPPLLTARGPSTITLEGGTHNPFAPPFDFLEKAYLPLVSRMGPNVTAELHRHGFFPAGGGKLSMIVNPSKRLSRLDLLERGEIRGRRATGVVANLPRRIAEKELRVIGERLSWGREHLHVAEVKDSSGPGNVVTIEIESEHATEVFTSFGERGVSAEKVGERAAEEAEEYLEAGVPVGAHLADQLLLPLAMAGGGSYRTLPLTTHSVTNIDMIKKFLEVEIAVTRLSERVWQVDVK
jgi:RNA 3'-terminal phosphate cyclase (ATP)